MDGTRDVLLRGGRARGHPGQAQVRERDPRVDGQRRADLGAHVQGERERLLVLGPRRVGVAGGERHVAACRRRVPGTDADRVAARAGQRRAGEHGGALEVAAARGGERGLMEQERVALAERPLRGRRERRASTRLAASPCRPAAAAASASAAAQLSSAQMSTTVGQMLARGGEPLDGGRPGSRACARPCRRSTRRRRP